MADQAPTPSNAADSTAVQASGKAAENDTQIASRKVEYLLAPRMASGLTPMSTDRIKDALEQLQGVTIVGRIRPTGNLSTFAAVDAPVLGDVLVAEMTLERGLELESQAGGAILIERNHPLQHLGLIPQFSSVDIRPTNIAPASAQVTVRVVGQGGQPLPKAQVLLYGGFPIQGETDQNGQVTLAVFGAVANIEAMYVKPFADHWEKWILRPGLKEGGANVISLDPLSSFQPAHFPGNPYIGWGQSLLGLSNDVSKNFSSKGVRVAIIDSGCDNRHPSLIHITRGLDYTNRDAADVPNPASWATDTLSHGTHCAGIIAGNGNGILGFAPDAEVHVLKLFPGGRFDDLISALKYCIDNAIDVVNCSLGSDNSSQAVQQWMERARQAGVAVVVAAGNSSGPVQFPALLPNVFCVSAVGQQGDFPADTYHQQTIPSGAGLIGVNGMFAARFSCFGPQVKVCAPGVAIISSVPGGGYAAWDGTSMAAPHITGLAALVAAQPRFSALPRNAAKVDLLFQTVLGSATSVGLDSVHAGVGLPSVSLALNPSRVAAGNIPGTVTSDDQASRQMIELIVRSVFATMLPGARSSL